MVMIKKGDQLLDTFVNALKPSVDNVSLTALSAADPALPHPWDAATQVLPLGFVAPLTQAEVEISVWTFYLGWMLAFT